MGWNLFARAQRGVRTPVLLALVAGSLAPIGLSPLGSAAAASTCTVVSDPMGAATGWTEFVETNGSRGSESEGSVAYGGSLNAGGNSMTVGNYLSTSATTPTLVVAGAHGSFNLGRGSAYVVPASNVNFNHPGGGAGYLASNPIDFGAAFTDLRDRSASLATATATGTHSLQMVGGMANVRVLTGTDATLNVFTLTAADVATAVNGFAFDVPASSTTLINVAGTAPVFQGKGSIKAGGSFQQIQDSYKPALSRILWNFPSATSLHLGFDSAWGGSVLAPDAVTTTGNTAHVIGQVVTKSYASNIETHLAPVSPSVCLPPHGTPPPPPPGESDIKVTKTAAPGSPQGGDQVTYTLLIENVGTATATGVVATDQLPAGVTYVSASTPCTRAAGPNPAGTITCAVGDVPAGGSKTVVITVVADPIAGPGAVPHPGASHHLTVTKEERQVDLEPGQTRTVTLTCPGAGAVLTDAAVRVDHVDQGTGSLGSVRVLSARTTSSSTWTAVVRNDAAGRAQTKAFAVCLPGYTEWADGHQHPLGASSTTPAATSALAVGRHTATLTCPAGTLPIVPGFDFVGGAALLSGSEPAASPANSWTFTTDVSAPTSATFSMRCLERQVAVVDGHTHGLRTTHVVRTTTVLAGAVVEEQVTCADDAKGIVGTWLLPPGVRSLGNDPRPKTRAYRLWNTTSSDQQVMVDLECLGDRIGVEELPGGTPLAIANTATVTSVSSDASAANNSSTAHISVQPGSSSASVVPRGSAGARKVSLQVLSSTRTGGTLVLRAQRQLLARGSISLKAERSTTVRLRLTRAGRSLLNGKGDLRARVTLRLKNGHAEVGRVTLRQR